MDRSWWLKDDDDRPAQRRAEADAAGPQRDMLTEDVEWKAVYAATRSYDLELTEVLPPLFPELAPVYDRRLDPDWEPLSERLWQALSLTLQAVQKGWIDSSSMRWRIGRALGYGSLAVAHGLRVASVATVWWSGYRVQDAVAHLRAWWSDPFRAQQRGLRRRAWELTRQRKIKGLSPWFIIFFPAILAIAPITFITASNYYRFDSPFQLQGVLREHFLPFRWAPYLPVLQWYAVAVGLLILFSVLLRFARSIQVYEQLLGRRRTAGKWLLRWGSLLAVLLVLFT